MLTGPATPSAVSHSPQLNSVGDQCSAHQEQSSGWFQVARMSSRQRKGLPKTRCTAPKLVKPKAKVVEGFRFLRVEQGKRKRRKKACRQLTSRQSRPRTWPAAPTSVPCSPLLKRRALLTPCWAPLRRAMAEDCDRVDRTRKEGRLSHESGQRHPGCSTSFGRLQGLQSSAVMVWQDARSESPEMRR